VPKACPGQKVSVDGRVVGEIDEDGTFSRAIAREKGGTLKVLLPAHGDCEARTCAFELGDKTRLKVDDACADQPTIAAVEGDDRPEGDEGDDRSAEVKKLEEEDAKQAALREKERQKQEAEEEARAEAQRIAEEKAEAKRLEAERIAAERAAKKEEAERLAAEKAAAKQAEADRIAAERAAKKEEAERLAAEKAAKKAEAERLAAAEREEKKAEADRLAAEKVAKKAEAERLAAERAEKKAEADRLAAVKKEEADRAAADRSAAKKAEAERLAAEKAAKKAEAERLAAEKAEAKKAEAERIAAEKAEKKAEAERLAAEKVAAKKAEEERIAAEKLAAEEEKKRQAEAANGKTTDPGVIEKPKGAIALKVSCSPAGMDLLVDDKLAVSGCNDGSTAYVVPGTSHVFRLRPPQGGETCPGAEPLTKVIPKKGLPAPLVIAVDCKAKSCVDRTRTAIGSKNKVPDADVLCLSTIAEGTTDFVESRILLSHVHDVQKKDAKSAEEILTKLVATIAGDASAEAHYRLADLLGRRKQWDKQRVHAEKAWTLRNDFNRTQNAQSRMLGVRALKASAFEGLFYASSDRNYFDKAKAEYASLETEAARATPKAESEKWLKVAKAGKTRLEEQEKHEKVSLEK
jgi:hypothetical protein